MRNTIPSTRFADESVRGPDFLLVNHVVQGKLPVGPYLFAGIKNVLWVKRVLDLAHDIQERVAEVIASASPAISFALPAASSTLP